MIVVDTNVIALTMQTDPDLVVSAWLDAQPRGVLWTTAVSMYEIEVGVLLMPAGVKRRRLEGLLRDIQLRFDGQVLPLDVAAARMAAQLRARRHKAGVNIELNDTFIAGIVLANDARIATRNTRHFADLGDRVIDPWSSPTDA